MVLRGNQNQARARFRDARLGRAAAEMNNANHSGISRENTSPHGYHNSEAENQRHEQRNHGNHPL
jgi:hypothetical protein